MNTLPTQGVNAKWVHEGKVKTVWLVMSPYADGHGNLPSSVFWTEEEIQNQEVLNFCRYSAQAQ